jgi:hypothetical protein
MSTEEAQAVREAMKIVGRSVVYPSAQASEAWNALTTYVKKHLAEDSRIKTLKDVDPDDPCGALLIVAVKRFARMYEATPEEILADLHGKAHCRGGKKEADHER